MKIIVVIIIAVVAMIMFNIIKCKREKKRLENAMARRVMIQVGISEMDPNVVQCILLTHGVETGYEIILQKYKENHGIKS